MQVPFDRPTDGKQPFGRIRQVNMFLRTQRRQVSLPIIPSGPGLQYTMYCCTYAYMNVRGPHRRTSDSFLSTLFKGPHQSVISFHGLLQSQWINSEHSTEIVLSLPLTQALSLPRASLPDGAAATLILSSLPRRNGNGTMSAASGLQKASMLPRWRYHRVQLLWDLTQASPLRPVSSEILW
jgi:hypothetical protein